MIEILKGTVTPKDWMAVGVMLGITAAIVAVFVFFVHKRQIENLDRVRAETTRVRGELTEAERLEKEIDRLREDTRKINQLVFDFNKRLPTETQIPDLVRQFESMANDVGLSHSLKPEVAVRDETKETIPYSVATFGNFHQTASFINRLERFERYLKISDLKIEKEDAGISKASFTLSTFRFLGENPEALTQNLAAANTGGAS
jgi:Tfp pilus assembly protein PilO